MQRIEQITINSRQDEDEADRVFKSIGEYKNPKPIQQIQTMTFNKLPETANEASEVFSVVMKRSHMEFGDAKRDSLDRTFALVSDGINPTELERITRSILAQNRVDDPSKLTDKQCLCCGKDFQARRSYDKFCSPTCGAAYRKANGTPSKTTPANSTTYLGDMAQTMEAIAKKEGVDFDNLTDVFIKYAIKQYARGQIKFRKVIELDD